MLFHVEITVNLPPDMDVGRMEKLLGLDGDRPSEACLRTWPCERIYREPRLVPRSEDRTTHRSAPLALVDDQDYQELPFEFTGQLDKLTIS